MGWWWVRVVKKGWFLVVVLLVIVDVICVEIYKVCLCGEGEYCCFILVCIEVGVVVLEFILIEVFD